MAVRWLLEYAEAGLFADPGVGKTSIVLAAVKVLKKHGLFSKGLIVVPQRPLHLVWPREIAKWLDFNELTLELLHGPKKDLALRRPADLYACTPEGLRWLTDAKKVVNEQTGKSKVIVDARAFKALGFDTLIVDESTKFKSNSDRTKNLKEVLHTFRRRWILTGDPAPNGLGDLFHQIFIADMGKSLGRYVTHFRREFMDQDPYGYGWTIRKGVEETIYKRVAPVVLRIDDSHLDIPQEVAVEIKVTLPEKAMKVYKGLEDDLIAAVEGGVVTAANAAAASGKCSQVAAGGLYKNQALGEPPPPRGERRPWLPMHDEKTDALEDLLEGLAGEPLLCAYYFHHDLERIEKRLARRYGVQGELAVMGVSTKRDAYLEGEWNAGRLPFLAAQWETIAHGLNLQRNARHVAAHTMTWNYEHYNQFIRRVRRQGNKAKRVFIHHVLAEGTLDEVQYRVVRTHKRGTQQKLFDALKSMGRRRGRN